MKNIFALTLIMSIQTTYATSTGYLVPIEDVWEFCEYNVQSAVAKVSKSELLEEIKFYKEGKTAKEPYKSCCGIEDWPLFRTLPLNSF